MQAQTFCPQFHYQALLPLTLDAASLAALATQDATLELWHHCARSQAVAAALSRGQASTAGMAGQQQVFLGSGSLPLQGLLTKPQVRCSTGLVPCSRCVVPAGATSKHPHNISAVAAAAAAADLLLLPSPPLRQGVRGWLLLKSQLGLPVGAVQLALRFSHIGGVPQDACPAAPSPLSRCAGCGAGLC